jgi:hypothetical protein
MTNEQRLQNKRGTIFGLLSPRSQRLFKALGKINCESYVNVNGPCWKPCCVNTEFETFRAYRSRNHDT